MFLKTCRCGKTKKNFKFDIGDFFVDECCIEAGFDELGKKKLDAKQLGMTEEELLALSKSDVSLEIDDEGEQPEPEIPSEETESEPSEDVDMDKEVEEAIQSFTVSVDTELQPGETAAQAEERISAETANGNITSGTVVQTTEVKKKRTYNRGGNLKKQP